MIDDAFVREFQRRAGLDPDGQAGPKTMAALDRVLPVARQRSGMTRIIWHWTAGTHVVTGTDRAHYHYIIAGDGSVVAGNHPPEANVSTADGAYAAHTLNCNTGSIGVAVAAMAGAVERPFSAGRFPITLKQVEALARLCARLCAQYEIPVTRETILSHAEVQPTLQIAQKGKWDIAWLPGMTKPGDPVRVGDEIRALIAEAMKPVDAKPSAWPGGGVMTDKPAAKPVAAPSESWLVALFRAIARMFGR